jgi:uroporphyrinogen-III synthase
MRLLVTRPEPDASAQAQEIRNLGHEAVLQPLLEFEALDFDPGALEAADGLIVTSRNALRALAGRFDPKAIARCPVFCVGRETERLLRDAGFETVGAVAETAEELAGRIAETVGKGTRLVHATGEHQAFDLVQALARDGISVSTLAVYTMKARAALDGPVVEEIERGAISGAILMSPRTAEIFVSLCKQHGIWGRARLLDYYCLAKSVANRLKALDPASVLVASRPDRAALLALLAHPSTPGQDRMQ